MELICIFTINNNQKDGTLSDQIGKKTEKGEKFSLATLLNWSVQILSALEYLKQNGIIHRDLKPE